MSKKLKQKPLANAGGFCNIYAVVLILNISAVKS